MNGLRYARRAGLLLFALGALCAAPAAAEADPEPVLAIVRVPTPWWAPDFLVDLQFARSIPRYAAIPGLLRKDYLRTDERALGGLYLWRSRADAERFYDETWRRDLTERYGEAPRLAIFVLDGPPAAPTVDAAGERGRTAIAVFTSTSAASPPACATPDAQAIESFDGATGLRRLLFFADAEAAEAFLARCPKRAADRDLDARLLRLPVRFDNRD
ncbi:MAG: hypothetical protein AAGC67_13635 [Myxococcota bacterium]